MRTLLIISFVLSDPALYARKVRTAPRPPVDDAIRVVAQMSMQVGTSVRLHVAEHWRRYYLYIEQPELRSIAVLDVTVPGHPTLEKQIVLPIELGSASVRTVAGHAALLETYAEPPARPVPNSIAIINFNDPANPKTITRLSGIFGILTEPARGLTYVLTAEGLSIIQEQPAEDPKLLEEWQRNVSP
jgi:hypothetical protein